MCGEMSGDPEFALILLGMGLDEFSMTALNVPRIKHVIRSVTFDQVKEIAKKALTLPTGKEVEDFAREKLKEIVGEI